MKALGNKGLYALLYVGNQAIAVLTTILVIRYGKEAFGLNWVLGVLLALGWGSVAYGVIAPTLSARAWSVPLATGLWLGLRTLLLAGLALALLGVVPASAQALVALSGVDWPWLAIFVSLGLLRSYAQVMSTYSIRLARHARVLRYQLVGRILEICLAVWGCLMADPILLALAWLIYPLAQTTLFVREKGEYGALPPVESASASHKGAWLPISASQALDLAMPTLWLHLGGPSAFVAYRAITAALANSALLPRYWFVVFAPARRAKGEGGALFLVSFLSAVFLAAVFLLGTGAVSSDLVWWSCIPLLINSLVMPAFSRMRQHCLNQGQLVQPAFAIIVGRIAEAIFLLLFSGLKILPNASVVVAYSGFALGAPALRFFTRRTP